MSESVKALKQSVRGAVQAALRGCGQALSSDGLTFLRHLQTSLLWGKSSVLVGFMPIRREPNVVPLMQAWLETCRPLYVPSYCSDTGDYGLAAIGGLGEEWLVPGKYGILEPLNTIQRIRAPFHFSTGALWLVPGVAFDCAGHRLGRGGGYYDRLLYGAPGTKVGVAFDCQVISGGVLPVEEHDVKMECLLTENSLRDCVTG